ncbi:MAG: uroporphyrinogen-III synthase [Planktomarina sp.]|nr:uroporphyrinogen-III synthase [Planktomarina sp.]
MHFILLLTIALPLLRKYKPRPNILGVSAQSYGSLLPYILLTRPHDQALSFAECLMARGVAAQNIVIDPILKIEAVAAPYDFSSIQGLLITSGNAVAHLPVDLVGSNLPTFCVGEVTTLAASKRGLSARHMANTAQGLCKALSYEHLTGPLLHLRGVNTTLDIAQYFLGTETNVQNLVTYQQTAQGLRNETYYILQSVKQVVLPVFSLRSAQLLCRLDLDWSRHSAVAISQAVADSCKNVGFGEVIVSLNPDSASMLGIITPLMAAKSG